MRNIPHALYSYSTFSQLSLSMIAPKRILTICVAMRYYGVNGPSLVGDDRGVV
jgi:hypothetical protein